MEHYSLPPEVLAAESFIEQAEFDGLKDFIARSLLDRNFTPQAEAMVITHKIEQLEELGFAGDVEAAKALFEIALRATDALRQLTKIVDCPTIAENQSSPVTLDPQETIEEILRRMATGISELDPGVLSEAHNAVSSTITAGSLGREDLYLPISPILFPSSLKLTRRQFLTAEVISLMIQKKLDRTRQLRLSDLSANSMSWPSREFRNPTQRMLWLAGSPTPKNLGANTGVKAAGEERKQSLSRLDRKELVYWVFNQLHSRLKAYPWTAIPEYEKRQFKSASESSGNYLTKIHRNNPPPPPPGHLHNLRLRWQYKASNLPVLAADPAVLPRWTDAALAYVEYVADGNLEAIDWPAFISERRSGTSKPLAATLREVFKDGFLRLANDEGEVEGEDR